MNKFLELKVDPDVIFVRPDTVLAVEARTVTMPGYENLTTGASSPPTFMHYVRISIAAGDKVDIVEIVAKSEELAHSIAREIVDKIDGRFPVVEHQYQTITNS